MTNFLTPKEAADRLAMSRETLRRWDNQGRILSSKTPGGHRRYALQDVAKLETEIKNGLYQTRQSRIKENLLTTETANKTIAVGKTAISFTDDLKTNLTQLIITICVAVASALISRLLGPNFGSVIVCVMALLLIEITILVVGWTYSWTFRSAMALMAVNLVFVFGFGAFTLDTINKASNQAGQNIPALVKELEIKAKQANADAKCSEARFLISTHNDQMLFQTKQQKQRFAFGITASLVESSFAAKAKEITRFKNQANHSC